MQSVPTRAAATRLGLFTLFVLSSSPLAAQEALDPTEIAAQAQAATVHIHSIGENGRRHGAGTGFLVSADGLIVTNFHVIRHAHSLRIDLANGDEHTEVLYVTGDPVHDVAVLRLPLEGLEFLRMNGAADAAVGQRIFTMGHPLGQTATFSDGLVSALRTVRDVELIQITAPISVGSSGGPVMNDAGEVIGIATMMLRGGQNINFAVPARHVGPLLARGEEPRPFAAALLPRERSGIASIGRPGAASRTPREVRSPDTPLPEPADPWEEEVLQRIERLDVALSTEGVARRSHAVELGALRSGQSDQLSIQLDADARYAMIGVCDTDCTDVDLELYSPDGTLLQQDVRATDLPHVRYRPTVSGTYRLRVTMSGCSASPCRYGVASFILQ